MMGKVKGPLTGSLEVALAKLGCGEEVSAW
jgi:hypothetical protein